MSLLGEDRYRIECGNNRDFYARIGSVNAVITDPPYGAETHRKERHFRDAEGNIANIEVPFGQLSSSDMAGIAHVCEESLSGWLILFCQVEQIGEWRWMLEGRALNNIRYVSPMTWVKPDAKPNFSGAGPGVGCESIATFWCGNGPQKWNGRGRVGTFHYTREKRQGNRHPTEKPLGLMKELVRLFTNPNDIVFDPFMGSGTTGVAALSLGRRFIGIEQNEEYFAEAKRRLADASIPTLMTEVEAKMPTLLGDTEFPGRRYKERLMKAAKEKING